MNKLKILFAATYVAVLSLAVPAGLVAVTSAATLNPGGIDGSLCQGAELEWTGGTGDCDDTTGDAGETVNSTVALVINIFSWVVGVVSVIMIIYGGFRYVTSAGNEAGVKSAKDTILYALIGLVIVALSQIIVKFVLSSVSTVSN